MCPDPEEPEDQAPLCKKGEQKMSNSKSGMKEFQVTPPLLVGCPLPEIQAGSPPVFPSGGTDGRLGQGRPRGLRSCTSRPRTIRPQRWGRGFGRQPGSGRRALPARHRELLLSGAGRPVLRNSRRPPLSSLGPRRSGRPPPAPPGRSAPPLSPGGPRKNALSHRSPLCQSTPVRVPSPPAYRALVAS